MSTKYTKNAFGVCLTLIVLYVLVVWGASIFTPNGISNEAGNTLIVLLLGCIAACSILGIYYSIRAFRDPNGFKKIFSGIINISSLIFLVVGLSYIGFVLSHLG